MRRTTSCSSSRRRTSSSRCATSEPLVCGRLSLGGLLAACGSDSSVVDIWHADAGGAYSGFDGATTATRYLRGAQVTNKDGVAEFTTIYPGWYQGRTTHIHAKVHLDSATVLTTQLFFDDALSTKVYASAAYAGRGERDQVNDSDGIFDASLVMPTKADGDGYLGAMTFNVRST